LNQQGKRNSGIPFTKSLISPLREVVMSKMNMIVKDFVYKVSIKRNLPESIAAEAFPFNLYYLGGWKDLYFWVLSTWRSRDRRW
jgi:poly(A) polymerase Pap1